VLRSLSAAAIKPTSVAVGIVVRNFPRSLAFYRGITGSLLSVRLLDNRERKCADTTDTVLVPCMGWPFTRLKYKYIFSNKIQGSNFIKQHSETVIV